MFQGFSEKTIDFMWGIRFNNEKTWFEAHKEEYLSTLYEPMKELSRQVYGQVMEEHGDLDLSRRVSRIYRDARRLHGQGPYKDHLWCSMEQLSDEWTARPTFWFELTPERYDWGMGYYMPKAVTMAKFRARLDNNPKPFEKMARAFNKQDEFSLEGEDYKKPKGETTALLEPWYNKKTLALTGHGLPSETFAPAFADKLAAGYKELMPFYRYFLSLEGDPDPRV
ncbi:conserved hypothetical protein [uncultured Eubacteriales bacterium]|uniref:TIGR02453 family protein n=1 Tax=uncultured Eubacteriales bacterium TaxID=172733 RepID=A0A212J045_9FIRM|nr:conserved hypothetical protein [uncultured Eubacteriales bacterium]